jgi:hypothetical protein
VAVARGDAEITRDPHAGEETVPTQVARAGEAHGARPHASRRPNGLVATEENRR